MEELKQELRELKRVSIWSWLAAIGIVLLLAVDWASFLIGG